MTTQTLLKPRPDDLLGNLPADDQHRILEWLDVLSYRDTLKQIAQEPPGGLGLKVNYTTLRNFYLKNLPMRLAIQRRDEGGDWKILSQQAAVEPIEFQNLIRESLEREVFLRLRDVEPDNDKPLRWMQCLLRLRAQEMRVRRPVPTPASEPSNYTKLQ